MKYYIYNLHGHEWIVRKNSKDDDFEQYINGAWVKKPALTHRFYGDDHHFEEISEKKALKFVSSIKDKK